MPHQRSQQLDALVFLANRFVAPLTGHGLNAVTAGGHMNQAIDDFAARFAKVREAISPIIAGR